jgi:hypothetical protein
MAADVGNSVFDVLVERMYPGADVHVVASVQDRRGCALWEGSRPPNLHNIVYAHSPDLVMLAGVPLCCDVKRIRTAIERIRANTQAEILVMTNVVAAEQCPSSTGGRRSGSADKEKTAGKAAQQLRKMAAAERVEFLDARDEWQEYVEKADKPKRYLLRGDMHANARGKQVLARLLESYFSLDTSPFPASRVLRTFTDGPIRGQCNYSGCMMFMMPAAWR